MRANTQRRSGVDPVEPSGARFGTAGGFALWARAFAVASLVHLTLPDFAQPGWTPPAILGAVGALALLTPAATRAAGPWTLGPWAFLLCAASTLWTLLGLRDVLTQSALLTVMAFIGAAGHLWRRPAAALATVRAVTAATYGLAALHKLNRQFFDPAVSCATHAWAVMAERWPVLPEAPGFAPALAYAVVAVEIALAVGAWRRRAWVWPLALGFHLPLTATLAPAFEAVMLGGLAASLTPRQRARWRRAWRTRRGWIVAGALAVGALDVAFTGGVPSVAVLLKLMVNGGLLVAATLALAPARPARTRLPLAGKAVLALWLFNGLTPYLGLQYQHSAAMLSNLRVDDPCHNSWVVPRALRGPDPYLRIDAARFGPPTAPDARPTRSAVLRDTLWHVSALHTMRRNWCVPALRPIALAGTWRQAPFAIPDLCAADWLSHLPGAAAWPAGLQLFQKNLRRRCDAPCVH